MVWWPGRQLTTFLRPQGAFEARMTEEPSLPVEQEMMNLVPCVCVHARACVHVLVCVLPGSQVSLGILPKVSQPQY